MLDTKFPAMEPPGSRWGLNMVTDIPTPRPDETRTLKSSLRLREV